MNKYLKDFYSLVDHFKTLYPNESGYERLTKCLIADEFENYYLCDNDSFELTEKQQEDCVSEIYNFYIDTVDYVDIFKCVKAFSDVLSDYDSYEEFEKEIKKYPNKIFNDMNDLVCLYD